MKKTRLLFFVSEDWYFWSHRRLLARHAQQNNFEVVVLTRVRKHGALIKEQGFELVPLDMDRHGKNIFKELLLLYTIIRYYLQIKPDLVHHVALKPVLYGKLAAILTGVRCTVHTFPGLGYVFQSLKWTDRLISAGVLGTLKLLFRFHKNRIIVQNREDADFILSRNICKAEDCILIRGSGVDLEEFSLSEANTEDPIILFASRLLLQKGILDFVQSAKILKQKGSKARFVIAGKPDENNPNSISLGNLQEWQNSGEIEWWGHQDDMPALLQQATIVVLPTCYGEGVPKILIEAAACGKPLIATDVAGCRDIVRHGINGYLVAVNSPQDIANMLEKLIPDAELCRRMGKAGRELVSKEFSISIVNGETMQVYNSLLDSAA